MLAWAWYRILLKTPFIQAWSWYPIEDSILALHKSTSFGAQYVTPGSSSFIGGVAQKKKQLNLDV